MSFRKEKRKTQPKSGSDSGIKEELRITTVLFCEWSEGGSLQKCLKETLDRLAPILKFKVREEELSSPPYCPTRICGEEQPVGEQAVSRLETRKRNARPGTWCTSLPARGVHLQRLRTRWS